MFKEIVEYARQKNLVSVENRRNSKISAYIRITYDGDFEGVMIIDKKNREIKSLPDFGTIVRSTTQANAIIETYERIFDMSCSKYSSYFADIESGSEECDSINAIYQFLCKFRDDENFQNTVLQELEDAKVKCKDIISWQIDNEFVEDMTDWYDWFDEKVALFNKGKSTENIIISSITGEEQVIIPVQSSPMIKNVGDMKSSFGLTYDCYVASANAESYQSYNFNKAQASQIGIEDAKQFVTGIENLLNNPNCRNSQFKLIYFYDSDIENIIGESLASMSDEERDMLEANENVKKSLVSSIFEAAVSGESFTVSDDMKSAKYYMCRFNVPSKGRFFASNETYGSCEELVNNLYDWYRDTNIVAFNGKTKSIMNFYNVLFNCISNRRSRTPYNLLEDEFGSVVKYTLLDAIYHGRQLPEILYQRALRYAMLTFYESNKDKNGNEIASSVKNIKIIYAQIIKAYLIRKGYKIMTSVSENVNVPYACGKLFATYEQLQYKYVKGRKLNRNLAQSYFSAAMKTPGKIFPILGEKSIVYLNNEALDESRVYFSRLIGNIMTEIGTEIPSRFDKDGQGCFVLGYYQQKAKFLKKKPVDNNNATSSDADDTANSNDKNVADTDKETRGNSDEKNAEVE